MVYQYISQTIVELFLLFSGISQLYFVIKNNRNVSPYSWGFISIVGIIGIIEGIYYLVNEQEIFFGFTYIISSFILLVCSVLITYKIFNSPRINRGTALI